MINRIIINTPFHTTDVIQLYLETIWYREGVISCAFTEKNAPKIVRKNGGYFFGCILIHMRIN